MKTKDEIFDEVMCLIDSIAITGAILPEELEQFNQLEKEYWIQTNNKEDK